MKRCQQRGEENNVKFSYTNETETNKQTKNLCFKSEKQPNLKRNVQKKIVAFQSTKLKVLY